MPDNRSSAFENGTSNITSTFENINTTANTTVTSFILNFDCILDNSSPASENGTTNIPSTFEPIQNLTTTANTTVVVNDNSTGELGSVCSAHADCWQPHTECWDNTCTCSPEYNLDPDTQTCVPGELRFKHIYEYHLTFTIQNQYIVDIFISFS